jgi:tetratricopeptide (TPR) repeat protein
VPPPPTGLDAAQRALWDEVAKRVGQIENENYFDMLGIARDAPSSAVQSAYFNLVKKWHPDRVPKELAALRPHVELIFRHLTRAQETLSDDAKRGPYLASVQDGGGTPAAERKLAQIVQAAMEFRKVEILLKRRELDEALKLVEECLATHDEDPDYHAAHGWILFQRAPSDVGPALTALDRAIALAPKHDRAFYYKGMVLDRAGRGRDAAECFRKAAELNPKNIEAVRMVRLAEMRGDTGDATKGKAKDKPKDREKEPTGKTKLPEAGGSKDSLLGKIFGRKR